MDQNEFTYVVLIFALFVLPRVFEKFWLPKGVSALLMGTFLSLSYGWFQGDITIQFLSTLGISSLFLFAGYEIDFEEIKKGSKPLLQHLFQRVLLLGTSTFLISKIFDLNFVMSSLFALAILTPSTGFILDSLSTLKLTEEQRFWVKVKAIATEIVALVVLFFVLQSGSLQSMAINTLWLVGMILVLPLLFKAFARFVAPYASHSEFAFFLMLAVLCGILTKKLGTYYLVGAFLVGVTARRYQDHFHHVENEKMLYSIRLFASFFIPFYFFNAGLKVTSDVFSQSSLILGALMFVIIAPLRIFSVAAFRKYSLKETWKEGMSVSISLLPTLIFGLVIASILRTEFQLDPKLFGALLVYTVLVTILPGVILKNKRIADVPEPFEGTPG